MTPKPFTIPKRDPSGDPIYDLACHFLRSSYWTEDEIADLAEKIHETIEAWFDANITEDPR